MELEYWDSRLVWGDVLHVLYKGGVGDFCASVLTLLLKCKHWKCTSWALSLQAAFQDFMRWCKLQKLAPHIDKFDVKATGIPDLSGKAWDIKLVASWLGFECTRIRNRGPNTELLQYAVFSLTKSDAKTILWNVMFCLICRAAADPELIVTQISVFKHVLFPGSTASLRIAIIFETARFIFTMDSAGMFLTDAQAAVLIQVGPLCCCNVRAGLGVWCGDECEPVHRLVEIGWRLSGS